MPNKGLFKVRKNWWQGLIGDIEFAILKHLIPDDLLFETNNFLIKFSSPEFKHRLTTREDIEEANALIKKILEANNQS